LSPENEDLPIDPFTALAEGAVQIFHLYNSYVLAGFTEAQAMQLLLAIITSSVRNAQPPT
jgi:hypothetical protein